MDERVQVFGVFHDVPNDQHIRSAAPGRDGAHALRRRQLLDGLDVGGRIGHAKIFVELHPPAAVKTLAREAVDGGVVLRCQRTDHAIGGDAGQGDDLIDDPVEMLLGLAGKQPVKGGTTRRGAPAA